MIDDLIQYYQRELAFLRDAAGAFADAYPKIASRLRLTRDTVEDPHVGRMIEAVALMNARLRHKIEDEFPEISDAMLQTLYPHLVHPVPSFFVARIEPSPDLDKPALVPRGTMLETDPVDGERCRYRLTSDTTLLPLRIKAATMAGLPYPSPDIAPPTTKGVLHLELEGLTPQIDFTKLGLDRLRFFVRSDVRKAQILAEQFGINLIGIGVSSGIEDPSAVLLPPTALRNTGFDDDALLLPQTEVASPSYAILQEFFVYPQKYLFFEVNGLSGRTLRATGGRLDLFFYFDRLSPELERLVDVSDFELFASPAINLFELHAEPILLNQEHHEYRIIPDARREDVIEVHSVTRVTVHDGAGERRPAPPLYSIDHGTGRAGTLFSASNRRSSLGPGGGDDVFLSIADLDGRTITDPSAIALPLILATNRELPTRLPYGGNQPQLTAPEPVKGVKSYAAITKPTPTRRPARRRAVLWKLIGQLSLNHLSFTGGPKGAAVLRELLSFYDLTESADGMRLRERIVGVHARSDVARIRLAGHAAICAGTAITLEVDDDRLSGSGGYLLCAVLERFLSGSTAINSFVRLSAELRREPGVWKTWPPRVGHRELI